MKFYKIITLGTVISSTLLMTSFQADAATALVSELTTFDTTATPTPPVLNLTNVSTTGWVSPSMSYKGWTHTSKWLLLDVAKGKNVKITLDSVTPNGGVFTGFHPGMTVWFRNTKLKANDPKLQWMDDHFYKQSANINVTGAKSDNNYTVGGVAFKSGDTVGNIVMEYVASTYDADGLGDKFAVDSVTGMLKPATTETSFYGPYLPLGYSVLGGSQGLTASTSTVDDKGKLTMSFTAAKAGVYQVALGGLKPDVGSKAATGGPCSDSTKTTKATCVAPATWATNNNVDVTITVQ